VSQNGVSTGPALDWLAGFVERRAVSFDQAYLLGLVIEEGRRQAATLPRGLPAAELPLAVYAAAGGAGAAPLALAAACLCVYLGADVLDSVVDRELSDRWADAGANQAILAGVTFLTPLAAAALAELDAPPAMRVAAQDALVDALIVMSAGQSADVAFEGSANITLAMCESMILAKSGAEWALFARLGALLAGADRAVCDAYATLGRELGATTQIISDGADVATPDESRDLATGKRTLPIVYGLSTLPDADRAHLLGHLDAAPHDPVRKRAARDMLLAAGVLHFVALAAEVHRQRALAALRSVDPTGLAGKHLYDWVDEFRIARRPAVAG
jgi:geranylgeranyl diphosphate synthase, type I